jgi:hypothetical protein
MKRVAFFLFNVTLSLFVWASLSPVLAEKGPNSANAGLPRPASNPMGWDDVIYEAIEGANDPLLPPPHRKSNVGSPYEGPPGYNPDRVPGPGKKLGRKSKWKIWEPEQVVKPPPEEVVVNVGPREFPPSPEPLLRLSQRWRTEQGVLLLPGLYLLQSMALGPAATAANGSKLPPKAIQLNVKQASRVLWQVPLALLSDKEAPQGPVETLEPTATEHKDELNKGPYRAIKTEFSPDGERLKLRYLLGGYVYESAWYENAD